MFERLASQYAGRVQFLKVDVDEAQDVAQRFAITAMPSFVVLKGSSKVDEVRRGDLSCFSWMRRAELTSWRTRADSSEQMKGANPTGLMQLVNKHAPTGAPATTGGSQAPKEKGLEGFVRCAALERLWYFHQLTPLAAAPQTTLNSQIDQSQVHCLNETPDHTLKGLLRGGGDKWLESDADEQLLLQIPVRPSFSLDADDLP